MKVQLLYQTHLQQSLRSERPRVRKHAVVTGRSDTEGKNSSERYY